MFSVVCKSAGVHSDTSGVCVGIVLSNQIIMKEMLEIFVSNLNKRKKERNDHITRVNCHHSWLVF